jgi:hypothetical protein
MPEIFLKTPAPGFAKLRCFVVDGAPDLVRELGWNAGHLVVGSGMLREFLHDLFFAVSASHEIAIGSNISATYCFCHKSSYGERV